MLENEKTETSSASETPSAPKKSKKKATAKKPKASKKVAKKSAPKEKKAKGPGVISTIKRMAMRGNGASKAEILAELKDLFPKRPIKGMERTVQIQLSRIPKESKGKLVMEKTTSDTRGKVYSIKEK